MDAEKLWLSMGMSHDFEQAIEYGSTHVRLHESPKRIQSSGHGPIGGDRPGASRGIPRRLYFDVLAHLLDVPPSVTVSSYQTLPTV